MSDTSSDHVHHAIDYVELSVLDLDAAKRFYSAAFGWTFVDYGPDYAGIVGEGREMGGLARAEEVRRGGPLVVLYSRDLDASVAAVGAAGGAIVTAPFDFPGGRRFHFTDPSGNELAVWSPAS
ncbi:MAG: VOC family protein [Myxococcota bacterium]